MQKVRQGSEGEFARVGERGGEVELRIDGWEKLGCREEGFLESGEGKLFQRESSLTASVNEHIKGVCLVSCSKKGQLLLTLELVFITERLDL